MNLDEIYTPKYLRHFKKWKFGASGNIIYGAFIDFYFLFEHFWWLKENLY